MDNEEGNGDWKQIVRHIALVAVITAAAAYILRNWGVA